MKARYCSCSYFLFPRHQQYCIRIRYTSSSKVSPFVLSPTLISWLIRYFREALLSDILSLTQFFAALTTLSRLIQLLSLSCFSIFESLQRSSTKYNFIIILQSISIHWLRFLYANTITLANIHFQSKIHSCILSLKSNQKYNEMSTTGKNIHTLKVSPFPRYSIKPETERSSVETGENGATSNFSRQFRPVYRSLVITDAIDSTVGCGVP